MTKKHLINNILTFTLVSVMTFSSIALTSCGKSSSNSSEKPTSVSKDSTEEQARFDEYMDSVFNEQIVKNTLNLHYTVAHPDKLGIDSYKVYLGDFSKKEFNESISDMKGYLKDIKDFDYDSLTDKQKLTYDIFKDGMKDSLDYEDYFLYEEYLSPLKGQQAQLPTLLADYNFNTEQDVKDYIDILKLFPDFFKNLMAFEKSKSDAGLFMPDSEVDEVIDQCQQFIDSSDSHYLISTFNEKIDEMTELSDISKSEYKEQNLEAFNNSVLPSYQYIIDEITKLKGTGVNSEGICKFKNGKDYYELIVRDMTCSDKSVEDFEKLLEKQLKADVSEASLLSLKNADIFDKMDTYSVDTSKPSEILSYLQKNITDDFPKGPDTNCKLCDVPTSMEQYGSPAYYLIPAIDDYTNNVVYINQSNVANGLNLYSTLAHEAFPGHLYQVTYFRNTNPANIRSLFSFPGYDEGWATYAESYSYTVSGQDDDTARINQINQNLSFDLYCTVDIKANYYDWSVDDAIDFCGKYGLSEDDAKEIYRSVTEEPALYLQYFGSYLEFIDMRDTAKEALGKKFNLKDFHEFILEIGPAPFYIIRDRMDTWIEDQK